MKIGLSAWSRIARGLLHSRSAFGIGLPLTARVRRHLGCGCSSVVEHDLAKVGVEGSSPFARSRFFLSWQIPGSMTGRRLAALSFVVRGAPTSLVRNTHDPNPCRSRIHVTEKA